MRKAMFLLVIVFFLGCATVAAKQKYKIGDELRITTPKGTFVDVVVVDITRQKSEATGEEKVFLRLKEDKTYTLPADSTMLGPRPTNPGQATIGGKK
jgi:hypothetical protein